jgi:pSer/pThr/pTyr-binding forkhead associated (FHA) protein
MLVAEALAAQGDAVATEVRVVDGPDTGKTLAIREFERAYVIGRGKDCDLALEDDDASRRHVEVRKRGENLYVRDLGSKNGSKLAAESLAPKSEQVWPKGALLELGGSRFSYEDPVLEALLELERSADERMREEDSVDPPATRGTPSQAEPEPAVAPGAETLSSRTGHAPIAAVPRRAPLQRGKRGISGTDVLVASLALLVLAVSVIGLLWLFRSD